MRSSFKTILCLSSLIILNSACKKDKVTSGGVSSAQGPAAYTNVYGALIAGKSVYYFGSSFSDTSYSAAAIFYSAPQPSAASATTVSVTSVSLNSKALYLYNPAPGEYIYEDTATSPNLSSVSWQIQGSGIIPSFSSAPAINYPSYSGYNLLPDTINIGQSTGTVIHLTGVTGADSLYIQVSSGSTNYSSPNLIAATTSYTIAQSKLANLPTPGSGQLSVSFEKILVQNVNGKNFVFTKSFQFNKTVAIINQ